MRTRDVVEPKRFKRTGARAYQNSTILEEEEVDKMGM